MNTQTLKQAQSLNKRLHRRVQNIEAPYFSKIASAQQDTARALNQVSAAQQESQRLLNFTHRLQEQRLGEFRGAEYLFWLMVAFYWWGAIATGVAVYFYFRH